MQWLIDIIVAICKAYTDSQIALLRIYIDEEIAKVNFNIGQAFLASKAYTDSEILAAKVIPSGTIILWSGLAATIPDGWVYCGGGDGTPDLRGLFIRSSGGGHPPGETGGSSTHTHSAGSGLTAGKDVTPTANNIPPYHTLVYIMKL